MYGLLEVDGVRLAVPLDVLREVVPWPAAVDPLPVDVPGLLGAVDVRGDVVPLLDLGRALGRADRADRADDVATGRAGAARVVAILVHEGGLLGLAVDAVRGVADVPDDRLQTVAPSGLVLRATFELPADGAVTSVLDVAALVATTGVLMTGERGLHADRSAPAGVAPVDAGPVPDAEGEPPATRATDVRPLIRVRVGEHQLCLPAVEIHAVLPALHPRASALDGPLCRGVTAYRGVDVPVADVAGLLGLAADVDAATAPGVLLRLGDGLVALAVSQVIDIEPLDVATTLPVPPGTIRHPGRYRGLIPHTDHGQLLLLDTDDLRADADLLAMAALNQPVAGAAAGSAARATDRAPASGAAPGGVPGGPPDAGPPAHGDIRPDDRAYLTYAIGPEDATTEVATLLEQVAEIVPFPAERAVTGVGEDHYAGVFVHRGRAVSLVCLSSLVGGATPSRIGATNVLVVETAERVVGFVVTALRAIERATWSESTGPGPDDDRPGSSDLGRAPAVKVSSGSAHRLLPALDLVRIALGLDGPVDARADGHEPDGADLTGLPRQTSPDAAELAC